MWRLARKSDHGTEELILFMHTCVLLLSVGFAPLRFGEGETLSDNRSTDVSANKPYKPASILFVAAFAAFLATFNETFLNVGFAPIMANLGVDVSTVQWLATAYMLGAAVMVPVSAFAYRSFPTRPLFCVTVLFLVIGSIIGALAQDFAVLLIGRIVQALGTGMLIPVGMNITLEVAPREKLGTYMGIMGAMTTLGPSSSVIIAGVILAFADWHMLLWVFAILSALCFLAGAFILRNIAHLTHPRLDALSVALIGIALIGLLYGISTIFVANIYIAFGAMAIGVIALVIFVKRQGKLEEPLINLDPLKVHAFALGTICNMLSLIAIFALNIILPTYMQSVLGIEPLIASLTLFPAILCSCVMSPIAGRIYDKQGIKILLPLGFACIAVFSVLVSLFIATASPVIIAVLYIPVICGSALIIGPVQSFALSKLPPEQNPHGVTVMSTGFQIAGCFGSSVFTGIYAAVAAGMLADAATKNDAFSMGMAAVGILVGVFMVAGFAIALYLRKDARPAVFAASEKPGYSESSAEILDKEAARLPLARLMKTDVFALQEDASVLDAMTLFSNKKISGVPVVNAANEITGFISDGDVMRSLADQVPSFKTAYSFVVELGNEDFDNTIREVAAAKVKDICTDHVICVSLADDLGAVTQVLAESHVKKAPVVEDGKMVGVINRSDITRYCIDRYLEEK